jgi:hypothetical protein
VPCDRVRHGGRAPADQGARGEARALENETFANNSTAAGQWYLPAGSGGTNGACLTAGPVSATTSVPNCAPTTDASGSGALRLTTNAGDAVGAVFYQASLPTTEGLDVTLDTYQFDGTGADGIVFTLAAANPADPTPPAKHRAARRRSRLRGEHPGLSGHRGDALRLSRHRARRLRQLREHAARRRVGLHDPVTARRQQGLSGVRDGARSRKRHGGLLHPRDDRNTVQPIERRRQFQRHDQQRRHGRDTLDKQTATTRAGVMVPVEMAINPSATATTTASGLTVAGQLLAHRVHAPRYDDAADADRRTADNEQQRCARNVPRVMDQPGDRYPIPADLRMDRVDRWIERVPRSEPGDRVTTLVGSVPDLSLTKSDNESQTHARRQPR